MHDDQRESCVKRAQQKNACVVMLQSSSSRLENGGSINQDCSRVIVCVDGHPQAVQDDDYLIHRELHGWQGYTPEGNA